MNRPFSAHPWKFVPYLYSLMLWGSFSYLLYVAANNFNFINSHPIKYLQLAIALLPLITAPLAISMQVVELRVERNEVVIRYLGRLPFVPIGYNIQEGRAPMGSSFKPKYSTLKITTLDGISYELIFAIPCGKKRIAAWLKENQLCVR